MAISACVHLFQERKFVLLALADLTWLVEEEFSSRESALLWGVTPFVYSVIASFGSSVLQTFPMVQYIVNLIMVVIYTTLITWKRPFSERWKNILQIIMGVGTMVSIVSAILFQIYPDGSEEAFMIVKGICLLVAVSCILFSMFVLLLATLSNDWAVKALKILSGPKEEGKIGPTEMTAAVARARADTLAARLSEPIRAQYLVRISTPALELTAIENVQKANRSQFYPWRTFCWHGANTLCCHQYIHDRRQKGRFKSANWSNSWTNIVTEIQTWDEVFRYVRNEARVSKSRHHCYA